MLAAGRTDRRFPQAAPARWASSASSHRAESRPVASIPALLSQCVQSPRGSEQLCESALLIFGQLVVYITDALQPYLPTLRDGTPRHAFEASPAGPVSGAVL